MSLRWPCCCRKYESWICPRLADDACWVVVARVLQAIEGSIRIIQTTLTSRHPSTCAWLDSWDASSTNALTTSSIDRAYRA